ncbi:hypothetical protein GIB67_031835 [Kingdonia uniflora]|uniref:HIT domain-containing protein n=1 Tax=Kingdonia uniflora TaxID=39325 RepID=A0A7J7L4K3_9MAGN|nr:hypothetical protein GIB67_031835 [Kingdonia uniflora]
MKLNLLSLSLPVPSSFNLFPSIEVLTEMRHMTGTNLNELENSLELDRYAESRHVEILDQLLHAAKIVAEKEGIVDGFHVVINNGPVACQSVYHLHLHVLGGRQMKWPPG